MLGSVSYLSRLPVPVHLTAACSTSARSDFEQSTVTRRVSSFDRNRLALLQARSVSLLASIRFATDMADSLDDFIICHREILWCHELHPTNIAIVEATTNLHNLGAALLLRYDEYGDPEDLDYALYLLRQSLQKWEGADTEKYAQAAESLVFALLLSYRDHKDLDQLKEVVGLLSNISQGLSERAFRAPEMFYDHTKRLHIPYTTSALRILSWRGRDVIDWSEAIARAEVHTKQAGRTGSLKEHLLATITHAALLRIRFMQGDSSAIDRSLVLLHAAMKTATFCLQYRAVILTELALWHMTPRNPRLDITVALEYLLEALRDENCRAERRMIMALEVFGFCASKVLSMSMRSWWRKINYRLLIDAYRATIYLLQRNVFPAALEPRSRMRTLLKFKYLTSRAASHAMALGYHVSAVDFIEVGRSLLWMYYSESRELYISRLPGPGHHEHLVALCRVLHHDPPEDSDPSSEAGLSAMLYTEYRKRFRRQLNARIQHEMAKAYQTFSSYGGADWNLHLIGATSGALPSVAGAKHPVIVFIASGQLCHALIISNLYERPQRLVFPDVTEKWLLDLASRMRQAHVRNRIILQRGIKVVKTSVNHNETQKDVEMNVLRSLWLKIMKPLADVLSLDRWREELHSSYYDMRNSKSHRTRPLPNTPPLKGRLRPRTRVFLCPTGVFTLLPLHAAGDHPGEAFSSHYVGSYIPTLGALSRARTHLRPVAYQECQVLLAAAAHPALGEELPFATKEASVVSSLIPNKCDGGPRSQTPLSSSAELLRSIGSTQILHLACHGVQDAQDPFSSGFMMQDQLVTVREMMGTNFDSSNAFLAFLSACDTARGDMTQPDQAMCLSTAMLLMGFKSIIATLWSMDDIDGPMVAKMVYTKLFNGNSRYIDPDVIPYALDEAVSAMKGMGLPPSRWACYVHVGV